MIDTVELKVELIRRRMPQWKLAQALNLPPSTFSDYLRGARPEPTDLVDRIEAALGLRSGSLASGAKKRAPRSPAGPASP